MERSQILGGSATEAGRSERPHTAPQTPGGKKRPNRAEELDTSRNRIGGDVLRSDGLYVDPRHQFTNLSGKSCLPKTVCLLEAPRSGIAYVHRGTCVATLCDVTHVPRHADVIIIPGGAGASQRCPRYAAKARSPIYLMSETFSHTFIPIVGSCRRLAFAAWIEWSLVFGVSRPDRHPAKSIFVALAMTADKYTSHDIARLVRQVLCAVNQGTTRATRDGSWQRATSTECAFR